MDIKEFKKLLTSSYRGIRKVKFLNSLGIDKKFGWKQENAGKYVDQELFDNYHERNRLKDKLVILRDMLEYVDYKCDFNEKGKCRHQLTDPDPNWKTKQCCCRACASEVGYFRFIPVHQIEYYASVFDRKNGFWVAGKGCAIENRHDRSNICINYNCHPDRKFRDTMRKYADTMRSFENRIIDLQQSENKIRYHRRLKKTTKIDPPNRQKASDRFRPGMSGDWNTPMNQPIIPNPDTPDFWEV